MAPRGVQLSQSGKEIKKSEMDMWTEAWLECSGFSDEETQCSESLVRFFFIYIYIELNGEARLLDTVQSRRRVITDR